MNSIPQQPRWRPRFTVRGVLLLTLLVALLLGWRSSLQRAELRLAQQANALEYAEQELARVRDELEERDRAQREPARLDLVAKLDRADLRGVTMVSPGNAFQRTSFQECNLENATLQGDVAAFQLARFDRARLKNAKLTGDAASFQEARFVEADLTGAVLTGGGSSFQKASFENATLIRARLVGSFQLSNISGARFAGADLSALDSNSLASCYFKTAPTYDAQTKFPAGFDPVARLWRRVSE